MSATKANLLLLFAGAVWGMGFIAQESAMDDIGPMGFIGLRFLLAGAAVLPLALYELRKTGRKFSDVFKWEFVLVGTVFFIGMAAQQMGLLATTVTNAGFLTALYVVLVPIILAIFFNERQPDIIWPSALLSFIGIFMLSGGEIEALTWGDWIMIFGAVFSALHVIVVGKIGIKSGLPVSMACSQFLLCGIYGMIGYSIADYLYLPEPSITREILIASAPEIIYAALIAGALAFTIQAVCQRHTSASAAAIFLSTESLFAALFGAIILGERLPVLGYSGCALIFAAILLVELAPSFDFKNMAKKKPTSK